MNKHISDVIFPVVLGFYLVTQSFLALAEDLKFKVVDSTGNPVPMAVIELDVPAGDDARSEPARMDQIDKAFQPHVLAIPKGSNVEFPNSDNIRHHVYSFSPAKSFEIKLYAGVPGAPELFDKQGIVVLGCNIHDSMLGYIYVGNSSYLGETNTEGTTKIPSPPDNFTNIIVWHAQLSFDAEKKLSVDFASLKADQNGYRLVSLPIKVEDI